MSARLRLFKSKVHRATVTHADLDYEGSITLDAELMDAAGILEHEQVHVWNISRGTRLVTYALAGDPGSRVVCINGAAAHLAEPGDKVIVATFADVLEEEARSWQPRVIRVDDENRIVDDHTEEVAGPKRRMGLAG
jgi:aspartate 1-decarboxylase